MPIAARRVSHLRDGSRFASPAAPARDPSIRPADEAEPAAPPPA